MKTNKVNWLITDNNITVNYQGQTHIISREDALADELIDAIKNNRLDEIPNLVSVAKRVEDFSEGTFVVRDGQVFVNGVAAPTVLANKIVKFANEGLPYEPLVRFAENLQQNPSFRAVNELFTFLEKNDYPITEDGMFIAFKKVREDFTDIYTGTMDNSPGMIVEVPRNQVDEDSNNTCSKGLHAAAWVYCHDHYGIAPSDVIVEVKINPADVVAVPADYENAKLRCCRYEVLNVVDRDNSSDASLRVMDQDRHDETTEIAEESFDNEEVIKDDYEYDYCTECGEECDPGYDICESCEYDQQAEEEEDAYPYDDELEG